MNKRKDNLTDVVEKLPKVEVNNSPKPPKNQQVVNVDGEVITLANKNNKNKNFITHKKSNELNDIERIIKEVVDEEMDGFEEKVIQKITERLKKMNQNKKT